MLLDDSPAVTRVTTGDPQELLVPIFKLTCGFTVLWGKGCPPARNIQPSDRGELEITDVNKAYLERKKLSVRILDKGTAWLDTGTFKSLLQASQFVQVIEDRQGLKIGCIEEIAYKMGYIDKLQLDKLAKPLLKSGYGKYLQQIK